MRMQRQRSDDRYLCARHGCCEPCQVPGICAQHHKLLRGLVWAYVQHLMEGRRGIRCRLPCIILSWRSSLRANKVSDES